MNGKRTAQKRRAESVKDWSFLDGVRGVYFVGDGGFGGYVKIGWSKDIGARLRNLETGRPIGLDYYAVIEDVDREVEAELHKAYAHQRVRGEWFRLEGRLLEVLEPAINGEDDWGEDD